MGTVTARDRHFPFDRESRDYQPDVADSIRLGQNATSLGNQFRSSAEKYRFRNVSWPIILICGATSQRDDILNRTAVTTKELAKLCC